MISIKKIFHNVELDDLRDESWFDRSVLSATNAYTCISEELMQEKSDSDDEFDDSEDSF